MRRLARAGLVAYGAALGVASVRAAADGGRYAVLLPPVFGTMHFAHGLGALRGAVRHGPPLAALATAFGLKALAARLAPAPQPVFAPSLTAATDAERP